MFCYQCEQTANHTGCAGRAGVCGKSAEVADLQDELTGTLITLARTANELPSPALGVIRDGLFATLTNVNFDGEFIRKLTDDARAHIRAQTNGRDEAAYAMERVWKEPDEDIRSLKSLLLFGLRGIAAYAWHARALGKEDAETDAFLRRALAAVGEDHSVEELLELALEAGRVNLHCMEILDAANTGAYGTPAPNTVSMTVAKGPFIVVTGHDLHDLHLLLEQTKDKGVAVYTHGEMLPALGYPELRAYPHLRGHFGTAWQNQQKEFDGLPAPVLFTTNCLMPPRASYSDRVFTTGVVSFPGATHIGEDKDFSPLIAKALELGGYPEDRTLSGVNGGTSVTTGYGHGTVLSVADKIVEAVKAGTIRRFFLVGGCDGARPGRNYYTEFVRQAPQDTVILTLACGKYRFNDLDLGTVGGLPRLLDMGQCNDAYGAVKVAGALAEAFGCGVNDLPLSMVLSWYEQKAVCILLSLLYLGIRNMRLGPSLPAFLSPGVLKLLGERYQLTPITTPEADLKAMLA